MVNVNIKHMHKVRAKGHDYWYHRKTGERLPDDEIARIYRVLSINEGLETPSRRVKVASVEAVANTIARTRHSRAWPTRRGSTTTCALR